MSSIVCRNRLEAEFESLIARYIDPKIKIDIDGDHPHTDSVVTIENIVDFYVLNESEIDNEGMVRALLVAIHFATDKESSKLSRWLLEVRPNIMDSIKPDMIIKILSKKQSNLLDTSSLEFMKDYTRWLIESYCSHHNPKENQYVLTNYVYRLNRKLMVSSKKTAVTERDMKMVSYFFDNKDFLSKLYDSF